MFQYTQLFFSFLLREVFASTCRSKAIISYINITVGYVAYLAFQTAPLQSDRCAERWPRSTFPHITHAIEFIACMNHLSCTPSKTTTPDFPPKPVFSGDLFRLHLFVYFSRNCRFLFEKVLMNLTLSSHALECIRHDV